MCRVSACVLAELRVRTATKRRLAAVSGSSGEQVQRALTAMREAGAPIWYSPTMQAWMLTADWSRPPELWTREELVAFARERLGGGA